jgi:hypothetical protein
MSEPLAKTFTYGVLTVALFAAVIVLGGTLLGFILHSIGI